MRIDVSISAVCGVQSEQGPWTAAQLLTRDGANLVEATAASLGLVRPEFCPDDARNSHFRRKFTSVHVGLG